jgi:hypothetical protein
MEFGSMCNNWYIPNLLYRLSAKIVSLFTNRREIRSAKVVIDLPFVSSYNIIMKIRFAGFFRPDHDPPYRLFYS